MSKAMIVEHDYTPGVDYQIAALTCDGCGKTEPVGEAIMAGWLICAWSGDFHHLHFCSRGCWEKFRDTLPEYMRAKEVGRI